MKSFVVVISIGFSLLIPLAVVADSLPQRSHGSSQILYGGSGHLNKTSRDTITLIGPPGSGAPVDGTFEDPQDGPDWNGWTHHDVTEPTQSHWQISDYQAGSLGSSPEPGNLAAWCGDLNYPSCDEEDTAGGYGNSWKEQLQWTGTVANPSVGVNVHLSMYVNVDTEAGYDFVKFQYQGSLEPTELLVFSGLYTNELVDLDFDISVEDYQGPGSDQVIVMVLFESDGAWSDSDCEYPTVGALQMDEVTVTLDQGSGPVVDFTDFESGFGLWEPVIPLGVGDFSQLWIGLDDLDYCRSNPTAQVAFIDDGQVVPGVGPSQCLDWCYGPNGFTVNALGGRLEDGHLHNAVESPVISWPGTEYEGALYELDVYRHETLAVSMPGIFYTWSIRSTDSNDPQDIEFQVWQDRNFVYMGGPDYIRESNYVGDLLEPGAQYVQVQATVYELGFIWGFDGTNATPAPYFDNVKLQAYPFYGPAMVAREIDLAQDNFPDIGEVDLANLGNNSVRFDMANNIASYWDVHNDPGDSIVVDASSVRVGAELVGVPTLHFLIRQNPLFDDYRTNPSFGNAASGTMAGYEAANSAGQVIPGKWAFDLPDSNFLFPGDVLHYFISATDDNGLETHTSTLPADTTGFSDFSRALSYHSSFTFRALPSVHEDPYNPGQLITPKVLFWNDFGNRGGQNEWHGALANLGFAPSLDYDTYYTNGPSSGVGNGLGGRATPYSLTGYDDLLYTSGNLGYVTLSNGDSGHDAGDDIGVIDAWLRLGDKDAFFTGDDLIKNLYLSGSEGFQFVQDWLGVNHVSHSIRPLIGNQSTPSVRAIPGNGVINDDLQWVAYGGCLQFNTFDVVEADVSQGAVKLAEFLSPEGATSAYPYSAATLMTSADYSARVITLPYDFMYIHNEQGGSKANAPLATRARLLEQVLGYFGLEGDPLDVTSVPGLDKFAVRSYPNPFNPISRIEYTMPQAGHLTLKVFNVRGELVKTLIDDHIETSGHVLWDGTDARGSVVSSGVYFYEARTAGQVQVRKAMLMK